MSNASIHFFKLYRISHHKKKIEFFCLLKVSRENERLDDATDEPSTLHDKNCLSKERDLNADTTHCKSYSVECPQSNEGIVNTKECISEKNVFEHGLSENASIECSLSNEDATNTGELLPEKNVLQCDLLKDTPVECCQSNKGIVNAEESLNEEKILEYDSSESICSDEDEVFDERENNKQNKTNKHRTTFNSSWLISFPWLKPSSFNGKDVLLCQLCIQHHNRNTRFQNSPWIKKGFATVRLDKIRGHERSQMHTLSVAAEATFLNKNENEKKEEENSKSFKAVLTAMKCLEFLVKHNLPHVSLFEDFVNFAIDELASPHLAPLRKAKNANYTSYTTINEFLDSVTLAKEEEILDDIKKSPCFSIMVDETSDVNNRKHMAVGVKYLKDGKNNTSFLYKIQK